MKAVVRISDVPVWQIGQLVAVYFPDTMVKGGCLCEADEPVLPNHKDAGIFCGKCDSYIRTCDTYCSSCGRKIDWKSQKVAEK